MYTISIMVDTQRTESGYSQHAFRDENFRYLKLCILLRWEWTITKVGVFCWIQVV